MAREERGRSSGLGIASSLSAQVVPQILQEENEMAEQVALCHIEHDGEEYNWGDPVPDAVIEAYPEAVGDKPLSAKDIGSMNKAELQEHLLKLSGVAPAPAPAPVQAEEASSE